MDGVSAKITVHENYIKVPIMAKLYVTPDFSIDFGHQIAFNVYSKATLKAKMGSQSASETVSLSDNTNVVDFGVGLGATYNITEKILIQGRYTMGVTHVINNAIAKNGEI